MRVGYVYMLASKPYGTLYIGVTNDIDRRVFQHREGTASRFTKRYGVTRLVWFEEWPTVPEGDPARDEYLNAGSATWKIALVDRTNPEWRGLLRAADLTPTCHSRADARGMGGRVKPGHDRCGQWQCASAPAVCVGVRAAGRIGGAAYAEVSAQCL